jgi:rhodanese-related sulfurtransferase
MRRLTMPLFLLALIALTLAPWACSLFTPDVNDTTLDEIAVNHDQLKSMLVNEKHRTVLVDVRQPEKYAKCHISGAINIFLPQIVADDPRLGDAYDIVVYGNDLFDQLGIVGPKKMLLLGYKNIHAYRGGLQDWMKNGERTEGTEATTKPATRPATRP